jgi:phosphohistidine phosphatase
VTEVYLVRHAIAEARDAERWPDDSLRPLTPEGVERFQRAARGLGKLVPTVGRVLSSPYARAWQTAEILTHEVGWPAPEAADELAAIRPARDPIQLLRQLDPPESLALVGHEPQLSSLASLLLANDEAALDLELKKGGVIALVYAEPEPGTARLRWAATPKLFRTVGAYA